MLALGQLCAHWRLQVAILTIEWGVDLEDQFASSLHPSFRARSDNGRDRG
jgi:hypothetical protein